MRFNGRSILQNKARASAPGQETNSVVSLLSKSGQIFSLRTQSSLSRQYRDRDKGDPPESAVFNDR